MVSVEEIYDKIDHVLKEMAKKIGSAELIILTTATSGHPVSYYSSAGLDDTEVQSISSLLSAVGEGLYALLNDLNIRIDKDMIFLETEDIIFVLALLRRGTLTVKVKKPALLGTVRAIIKVYMPKFDELLTTLDEAQAEMWKNELLRETIPAEPA